MRISIIGTTGSGKSFLGNQIALKKEIPFYDLDDYRFKANWESIPDNDFIEKIDTITNNESWVCAGNYAIVRHIVISKATHVVWLDYSPTFTFFRLLKRTISRSMFKTPICNGNYESWKISFFSKESILLWFFKTYRKRKINYPNILAKLKDKKVVILKNQKETDKWLSSI